MVTWSPDRVTERYDESHGATHDTPRASDPRPAPERGYGLEAEIRSGQERFPYQRRSRRPRARHRPGADPGHRRPRRRGLRLSAGAEALAQLHRPPGLRPDLHGAHRT